MTHQSSRCVTVQYISNLGTLKQDHHSTTHQSTASSARGERISWLLKLEDWRSSLNTHYFSDYKNKFLAHGEGTRDKYEQVDIIGAIRSYNSSGSNNTG